MGLSSFEVPHDGVIVPRVGTPKIRAPGDAKATTTKALSGEDQPPALFPQCVKAIRNSRIARRSHQICQACQSSATQDITFCMVCEYMAIYGRKPYALLLHRRIRNKGDAIATMIGVPKSQLEQEMPRAALEYLLTGKSKDGKYPVYAPDTASTSPSSISDSEWEETLLSARSSLGEETVTSILEKLEQGLLEKLDALPGDDVPPEERDAIVTKVIKSIEGTMAADASDFAEAVVSIGGRRKRAPWK